MLKGNNKEYVEDSLLIFYYFRIIKVIYIFELFKNKATEEIIAVVWFGVCHLFFFCNDLTIYAHFIQNLMTHINLKLPFKP